MTTHNINFEEVYSFLEKLSSINLELEFLIEKQKIIIYHQNDKVADFRLPLPLPIIEKNLEQYLINYPKEIPNYVIYMIQSGSCSLAYYEEGLLIEHKVIKTYMVRKKQGKSQIKHLNSKGKSKAGSRIRLANTIHFFEDINERLQHYFEDYFIEKIIYSCPTNMLSLFYDSKVKTPFDKKDIRLIKIPKDVNQPCFEELLKINKQICQGELTIYQNEKSTSLLKLI